jgi:Tol biopolymer transport system component
MLSKAEPREVALGVRLVAFYPLSWLPDSRHLLAIGKNEQNQPVVWRIDSESGDVQPVRQAAGLSTAAFSPDGKFAYVYKPGPNPRISGIARVDLDTGAQKEIYAPEGDNMLLQPRVSPDGRWLSFQEAPRRDARALTAIVVVSADGNAPGRKLVEVGQNNRTFLGWSADSKRVLYTLGNFEDGCELWSIPAEGGTATSTGLRTKLIREMHAHPDGTRLAYSAVQYAPSDVWVIENLPL